jgi:hypothetical protein
LIELTNATYRSAFYEPTLPPDVQIWVPSDIFMREDAELSLFAILQNSLQYFGPVYDPLFSANGSRTLPFPSGNITVYGADNFVNALACFNQVQYCNPNNDKCTKITHLSYAETEVQELDINEHQALTVSRFSTPSVISTAFWTGVGSLGIAGIPPSFCIVTQGL